MTTVDLSPDPSDDDIAGLLDACGLRVPPSCGTVTAYMRHLHRKETPCQPCRGAYLETRATWVAEGSRKRPINHGTASGARVHQSRHEKPCPACTDAYNTYQQGRRAARKARAAA